MINWDLRLWIEKCTFVFVIEKVKTEETMPESESESESVKDESEVLQSPGSACSQTNTTIHTKSEN